MKFKNAYTPVVLACCLVLIVILKYGFIFLMMALLPSLVAYYVDSDNGKPAFKVVCACNLTATIPSLLPMMRVGFQSKQMDLLGVIQEPKVWLFVYLGAAAGWGLIYLCRFIARFLVIVLYEYNIANLGSEQKRLVEEWGPEVTQLSASRKHS